MWLQCSTPQKNIKINMIRYKSNAEIYHFTLLWSAVIDEFHFKTLDTWSKIHFHLLFIDLFLFNEENNKIMILLKIRSYTSWNSFLKHNTTFSQSVTSLTFRSFTLWAYMIISIYTCFLALSLYMWFLVTHKAWQFGFFLFLMQNYTNKRI